MTIRRPRSNPNNRVASVTQASSGGGGGGGSISPTNGVWQDIDLASSTVYDPSGHLSAPLSQDPTTKLITAPWDSNNFGRVMSDLVIIETTVAPPAPLFPPNSSSPASRLRLFTKIQPVSGTAFGAQILAMGIGNYSAGEGALAGTRYNNLLGHFGWVTLNNTFQISAFNTGAPSNPIAAIGNFLFSARATGAAGQVAVMGNAVTSVNNDLDRFADGVAEFDQAVSSYRIMAAFGVDTGAARTGAPSGRFQYAWVETAA